MVGAVTLFPYFIFTTALSSALTALIARDIDHGNQPTLGRALSQLGSRFGSFLKASLLCGVFIVVGLPVLLPAIYFMAIYLFVPLIAVFDAPAPAFSILARSKNLAKTNLKVVLTFTLASLATGLLFFLIQGEVEKLLLTKLDLPLISGAIADSFFAMTLGVIVNLGAYALYVALLTRHSQLTADLTQKIISDPNR